MDEVTDELTTVSEKKRPKRKDIPIRIKLEACLILLGFDADEVRRRLPDFDHHPAIGLRPVNEAGDDYEPAQLDPRYLRPLQAAAHAQKTHGRRGESKYSSAGDGDTTRAAKLKRLEDERIHRDFRQRLLATGQAIEVLREARPKAKAKRKIPSRPFPKGRGLKQHERKHAEE